MLDARYLGLRLIPSKSARHELLDEGLLIEECKEILEKGYDAPRKRQKGTIERWADYGTRTYNVVVVQLYNHLFKEDVFLITHVGSFSRKKR